MDANTKPALVRTGTPIAAGPILIVIARLLGLDVGVDELLVLLPVLQFGYYVLGRALETYNPKLGYVLGIAKAPAYAHGDPPKRAPRVRKPKKETS